MSSAFLNGVDIFWGVTTTSPETMSAVPEVRSLSGLGKTNPLVDVTNFDSAAREYIAGLADGQEVTLECNYLPGNTVQGNMITGVNNGVNRYLRVRVQDAVHSPTTTKTYTMEVTMLSWVLNPSFEDANTMTFTMKISGDITVV
jgi:hypothetical protein